jgi:biofilm PGA synthesis N-glycosyltransferase PgaC
LELKDPFEDTAVLGMEMVEIIILWFAFGFFSFGILGLVFFLMRKVSTRPWHLEIDKDYMPKVSILVPTYNESEVIRFKLQNLSKLNYPKSLTQIIIVDSDSSDDTVGIAKDFASQHQEMNIVILMERERKGKSAALNVALKHCIGEVVIVSDADCFWPLNILQKTLPFLTDQSVGGVSGPKIIMNPKQSRVTKSENMYLNLMARVTLGQSKVGSSVFFEGGFSAYKKKALESFDPYNTGSDDCGTIIGLIENDFRAIFIPEAQFYTTFPPTWKEKISIKLRRTNQLVRVFGSYLILLLKGRIKSLKSAPIQSVYLYLLSPVIFVLFGISTFLLLMNYPYFALLFLAFLIPRINSYLLEAIQNYLLLFVSLIAVIFGKRFTVWTQPGDRSLLEESLLRQYELI